MRLLTRKAKHSDVITATDVAERIPKLLKKMPHMIHGLILANDTRPNKPMGFGFEFERATRENPYGIALYYLDVQYTYTQFNEWANKIAHYLLSCGIKKGDVITVLIENRPELLVTSLACAKVGAIAALVNCSQTGKSLIHSVNLVKPKMLIVGDELKASVNEVKDSLELEPNQFYWLADEDTRKPRSSVTKPVPAGYQDLAELIIDQPRFNPPCSHHVFHGDFIFIHLERLDYRKPSYSNMAAG
jgi:citronellyl-CoA synthetase